MGTLEELEATARELRALSIHTTKEHAKLKRKAKATVELQQPTAWMRTVAVMVYIIAGCDAAAVQYVQWKKRQCNAGQVETWASGLSSADREALLDPGEDQPRARRQLAEARKFLAERQIVVWVQSENKSKRLAPTPGVVVDKAHGSAGPSGRRSSRYKWLRRVCQRWGGRKCVFGVGDQLTSETFDHKASVGFRSLGSASRCQL